MSPQLSRKSDFSLSDPLRNGLQCERPWSERSSKILTNEVKYLKLPPMTSKPQHHDVGTNLKP